MESAVMQYKLEPDPVQEIEMPAGAKLLSAQAAAGSLLLWVLANPAAPAVARKFAIFKTGQRVTCAPGKKNEYVGTFPGMFLSGAEPIFFHLFEVKDY